MCWYATTSTRVFRQTAIAARVGISRRTLYHWLATGQLDRDLDVGPVVRYPPRPSKLDPYKPLIRERLETYPELTAVRLFEEVRAAGYLGSLTQLKVFVRQVRPRPEPEPLVRFETPPGLQAQVDFARVVLPWGVRWALLVVLGYSRLLWFQCYLRQTMGTLMQGLEAAFHYFGGVPRELLFDQLKAVILDDQRPAGGRVLENPVEEHPNLRTCEHPTLRTGSLTRFPVGASLRADRARSNPWPSWGGLR